MAGHFQAFDFPSWFAEKVRKWRSQPGDTDEAGG